MVDLTTLSRNCLLVLDLPPPHLPQGSGLRGCCVAQRNLPCQALPKGRFMSKINGCCCDKLLNLRRCSSTAN